MEQVAHISAPAVTRDHLAELTDIRLRAHVAAALLRSYDVPDAVIGRTEIRFEPLPGSIFDGDSVRYAQYENRLRDGDAAPLITIDPLIDSVIRGGGIDPQQLEEALRHELGHLVYDHAPVTRPERRIRDVAERLRGPAKLAIMAAVARREGLPRTATLTAGCYLLSNTIIRLPAVSHRLYRARLTEDFARRFAQAHRTARLLDVRRPEAYAFVKAPGGSTLPPDPTFRFDIWLSRAITPRPRSLLRKPAEALIRALQSKGSGSTPDRIAADAAAHRTVTQC